MPGRLSTKGYWLNPAVPDNSLSPNAAVFTTNWLRFHPVKWVMLALAYKRLVNGPLLLSLREAVLGQSNSTGTTLLQKDATLQVQLSAASDNRGMVSQPRASPVGTSHERFTLSCLGPPIGAGWAGFAGRAVCAWWRSATRHEIAGVKHGFVNALRAAARTALVRALPARTRLPFEVWLAQLRGAVEPELRYLHLFCPRQGSAVDVGAHRGHYSYRLSKLLPRVVAFEVNADLLVDLENYNPGNIRVVGEGLSSAPAEVPLFIPLVDGRPLTGWGSLTKDNLPGATRHLTKSARVTTLDAFGLDDVSFIKIDVEGHELEVLKGAVKTLARCRPMLLVEVKSHNAPAVDALLTSHGYSRRRLEDLIGITGSPENAIFIANKPSVKARGVRPYPGAAEW